MVNLIKGECYWKSPRITFSQTCVFFFYKDKFSIKNNN